MSKIYVKFHKNCNKDSIIKFLAYRVYEGYDKAVEDETSHTHINLNPSCENMKNENIILRPIQATYL